jgi:hypothetical protein
MKANGHEAMATPFGHLGIALLMEGPVTQPGGSAFALVSTAASGSEWASDVDGVKLNTAKRQHGSDNVGAEGKA